MTKKKTVIKTYSTPEAIYNEFTELCERKGLNRSAIIRNLIVQFIEEEKEKDAR